MYYSKPFTSVFTCGHFRPTHEQNGAFCQPVTNMESCTYPPIGNGSRSAPAYFAIYTA
jgi:hypothetical protein